MNRSLLIALGTLSLSACTTTEPLRPGGGSPPLVSVEVVLPELGRFGQAMLANPEVMELIHASGPVIIAVPDESTLAGKTLSTVFLKSHVHRGVDLPTGRYASLSDWPWEVRVSSEGPTTINDASLKGCGPVTTRAFEPGGPRSLICHFDWPLAPF